jgi:putative ABC transport system ATP-binding protein
MKAYFSALIDKSTPRETLKLSKKLSKELKKLLKTPKSNIVLKEHNAFLFLAAEKHLKKPLDPKILENVQTQFYLHLERYYAKNKSNLQKHLKGKRELKETSQIVKDFLKEIDPGLKKVFDLRLKKLISALPAKFYDLQADSMTAIWNLREEQKVQFCLSGWPSKSFMIPEVGQDVELEVMVDKLAFLNFFCIFLEPTLIRLREMNKVLERLELGLQGTHYKSSNSATQSKLEMFLRILSAKLSSLQNMDKTIVGIFKLFNEPKTFFNSHDFIRLSQDLRAAVRQMSWKINQGKSLLAEVQEKLEECQIKLKDYLDEKKNGVKTTASREEFKLALLTMAELSSDLFVEAEELKLWLDFFGSDLPFFTFQSNPFTIQKMRAFTTSAEHIISVRSLVKNYSLGQTTVYALRGVDLDVGDGEFLAIVGNSGAGKTTLLNCIAGLDDPDDGVVFFQGKDLHRLDDSERSRARLLDMGFIFQSYALLPHFDTRENVALPADIAGFSKDLKSRIEELLEGVGIDNQAKQYPAQLSGGQLQRVAIARALTNRPKVLFADEPTGDLDSKTGHQVMELIKKFHEETGTTVIVITHEQDIANYAERQILMEDGKIIGPHDIKDPHNTKVTSRREEAIPIIRHEERANRKQKQHSKLFFAAFVVQMILAVLIIIMLLQLDQIVHGTLYSYGLQFSNTWALPYWTLHRFVAGLTLLIFGLSALLTVYLKRVAN